MTVGVAGDRDAGMPEPLANHLQSDPAFEGTRCVRMAKGVELHNRDADSLRTGREHLREALRVVRLSQLVAEDVVLLQPQFARYQALCRKARRCWRSAATVAGSRPIVRRDFSVFGVLSTTL